MPGGRTSAYPVYTGRPTPAPRTTSSLCEWRSPAETDIGGGSARSPSWAAASAASAPSPCCAAPATRTSPSSSAASGSAASGTTTPIPAPPATFRRTSTSSRSPRTRAGRAATRPRPRSRPTSRTSRGATGCSTASAPRTEVQQARWDGERGKLGAADERGTARGRRAAHRLRPALGADGAGAPRPRQLRGPGVPHRASGATTSTSPASGWRWSAPAAARSRRARDPADRRADRRLPALARLDDPEDGLRLPRARPAAVRALPGRSSGSTAPAIFAFMELGTAAHDEPALAAAALPRGRAPPDHEAIDDPELRRKVTPRDEVGCKRIMLTDDWYPTLTKPNVDLVTDRIAEITATGHPHRGRHRAPRRRARARDRLRDARLRRADGDRRRRRPHAGARSGRTCRARTSGMSVPGFPNMFLLYGPNTNGGTGSVIYTIEAGMAPRDRRARRARARATRRRSSCGARRPRRSTASCAPRWPKPSGTPAARTGTSTRTATTRASGRGCGAPTAAGPLRSSRARTS